MDDEPFEIILSDSNEESAHFRLQNEPGEKQREHITGYDRKDALRVLGKLAAVVHGRTSEDNDTPCSLAIFEFAALGQKPGRRYREVQIEIMFAAYGTSGRPRAIRGDLARWDPQVVGVAPRGARSLLRTTRTKERKHGFEASVEAGTNPLASAGVSYTYEISDSIERGDSMVVEGTEAFVNRAAGKPNAARFTLRENASQKSGVPKYLRVAVLLERRVGDEGLFLATVNVRAHVSVFADAKERVRRTMGKIPMDDAVCFDPKIPPTTDKYPVNNLASVSLCEECSIESGYNEKDEAGVGSSG
ncbi:hypothetical protein GL218_09461 [Daldinia childiae]|uniref:uncharacterized protein n=1 Tax=Daldinia childiae TaxID=326645 RepID=UPI001447F9C7|nr:uncharacterized protein GL218_09461 [Daldinia childiae]KAF3062819.1 hypothetical protein GL218_09461 [Daldinia childiae]